MCVKHQGFISNSQTKKKPFVNGRLDFFGENPPSTKGLEGWDPLNEEPTGRDNQFLEPGQVTRFTRAGS